MLQSGIEEERIYIQQALYRRRTATEVLGDPICTRCRWSLLHASPQGSQCSFPVLVNMGLSKGTEPLPAVYAFDSVED